MTSWFVLIWNDSASRKARLLKWIKCHSNRFHSLLVLDGCRGIVDEYRVVNAFEKKNTMVKKTKREHKERISKGENTVQLVVLQ
jgi:hypothetical protein